VSKFFAILRSIVNSTAGRGLTSCAMLFSSFLAVISAFPTLESYIKYGRQRALSSLLFGTALSLVWGGPVGAACYLAIVGVATIFVGELINRGCSVPRTILYSGLLALSCFMIAGVYINLHYAVNPLDFLSGKIDAMLTLASSTYPESLKNTLVDTGMTQKELSMYVAIKLPAIMVAAWILFLFINVLFASRFNYKANTFFKSENLSKFKTSDFLVIPTILLGALYAYSLSSYNSSKLLETASAMMFATFVSVYFLQGLLIAFLLVKRIFVSGFWSTMFVLFLAAIGYMLMAGVGFFDTWFDFRKYFLNKDKKGEEL
jgi:hypothetical protein